LHHPASDYVTLINARRQMEEAAQELLDDVRTEAEARGRAMTLEALLESF
jgi:hypothetical protein